MIVDGPKKLHLNLIDSSLNDQCFSFIFTFRLKLSNAYFVGQTVKTSIAIKTSNNELYLNQMDQIRNIMF